MVRRWLYPICNDFQGTNDLNWRVQLTEAIRAIHLLPGDPPQLAVMAMDGAVYFFEQHQGAYYGYTLPDSAAEPGDSTWPAFAETLRAPNGAYLPRVLIGQNTILSSYDGRLRVFQRGNEDLLLDLDGQTLTLDHRGEALTAVGLDRELGTLAALTADGTLHIYQQHIPVGAYSMGLSEEAPLVTLLVPDAADSVLVVETNRVRMFDLAGHLLNTAVMPSIVQVAACTPDGSRLITGHQDQGVMRVYDVTLQPLRQQTAPVILAEAQTTQLIEDYPPDDLTFSAIDIADDGTLSFCWDGALCLTHSDTLPPLPRARLLF